MIHIALVHGMGGTAATMQPLADRLRDVGFATTSITLPGHGTMPEDLQQVAWEDWREAIPAADVIVGQSMGGSLALDAAARRPDTQAVVAINALAGDPDALDGLEWRRSRGHQWIDEVATADGEVAYDRLPIGALLAMVEGVLLTDLSAVTQPVLLITSADDDAVDPGNSDVIASGLSGPVSRLTLPHGGHVASLGPEVDTIAEAITRFVHGLDQR
jgi:carboxylesterase